MALTDEELMEQALANQIPEAEVKKEINEDIKEEPKE